MVSTFSYIGFRMKIPVNSIEIPGWIVELCVDWHGGLRDMLYAVASTGGLTLGEGYKAHDERRKEEVYLAIWRDFSYDMDYAARIAHMCAHSEAEKLALASEWVDAIVVELCAVYGFEG